MGTPIVQEKDERLSELPGWYGANQDGPSGPGGGRETLALSAPSSFYSVCAGQRFSPPIFSRRLSSARALQMTQQFSEWRNPAKTVSMSHPSWNFFPRSAILRRYGQRSLRVSIVRRCPSLLKQASSGLHNLPRHSQFSRLSPAASLMFSSRCCCCSTVAQNGLDLWVKRIADHNGCSNIRLRVLGVDVRVAEHAAKEQHRGFFAGIVVV